MRPGRDLLVWVSALAERDARKQKLIYCASVVDGNWYFAEDWGVWMAKRRAGVLFRTPYAPGEVAAVYLELQLASETPPSSARFSVLSGGEPVEVCYFDSQRQWFVFEVPVGAMGEVDIELVAMGEFNPVAGGVRCISAPGGFVAGPIGGDVRCILEPGGWFAARPTTTRRA